ATAKSERLLSEKAFEDVQGLLQACNALCWWVKGNAGLFIFIFQPSCSDTKLEAPSREQIQCCRFLGKHSWMPIIVGKYKTADMQFFRRISSRHNCWDGSKLMVEVSLYEMIAN